MSISLLMIERQRYIYISNYSLPQNVAYLYHPSLVPLLVLLPNSLGTSDPMLYVPTDLWCAMGNPIHLNLSAPAHLAVRGWKHVCMEIIGGWNRQYTTTALLRTIDKFFAGYPFAP